MARVPLDAGLEVTPALLLSRPGAGQPLTAALAAKMTWRF